MLTVKNRANLYVIFIILLLFFIAFSSYTAFLKVEEENQLLVSNAMPLSQLSDNMLTQIINEETGIRGLIVSGETQYLEPYYQGKEQLTEDVKAIKEYEKKISIMDDEKAEFSQIEAIHLFFQKQIALVENGKIAEAKQNVDDGKALMDEYRSIHLKNKESINQFMMETRKSMEEATLRAKLFIVIGGLLAIIMGIYFFLLSKRVHEATKSIKKNKEQLHALFEYANDAIFVFSLKEQMPSNYLEVNHIACELLGYTKDEFLTMTPALLTPKERVGKIPAIVERVLLEGQLTFEGAYVAKNGTVIPFEFSTCVLDLGDEKVIMSIGRDIRERKKTEEFMKNLAYYDHLTQLPNRRLFEDRLDQAIQDSTTPEAMLGVMFIDLDGFKQVNDTFGHDMGDLLLKEVAARLSNCVRKDDTVARIAGDEFTLLFPSISKWEALSIGQRILHSLQQPLQISGTLMTITPSIGITVNPIKGMSVKGYIKQADMAMYQAKEQGKNRVHWYEEKENCLNAL